MNQSFFYLLKKFCVVCLIFVNPVLVVIHFLIFSIKQDDSDGWVMKKREFARYYLPQVCVFLFFGSFTVFFLTLSPTPNFIIFFFLKKIVFVCRREFP